MNENIKKLEEKFKKDWEAKDWEEIWYDLEFVISNSVKKESNHHKRPDFQEIVDSLVINQFTRLKNHLKKNPNFEVTTTLATFVHAPVWHAIHSEARRFQEQIFYPEYFEEKHD